jgi:hypothetical protein
MKTEAAHNSIVALNLFIKRCPVAKSLSILALKYYNSITNTSIRYSGVSHHMFCRGGGSTQCAKKIFIFFYPGHVGIGF